MTTANRQTSGVAGVWQFSPLSTIAPKPTHALWLLPTGFFSGSHGARQQGGRGHNRGGHGPAGPGAERDPAVLQGLDGVHNGSVGISGEADRGEAAAHVPRREEDLRAAEGEEGQGRAEEVPGAVRGSGKVGVFTKRSSPKFPKCFDIGKGNETDFVAML